MAKVRTCQLSTEFEKSRLTWEEYPRPQMRRDSYISLCGEWELFCHKGEFGEPNVSMKKLGNIVGLNVAYLKSSAFCILKLLKIQCITS